MTAFALRWTFLGAAVGYWALMLLGLVALAVPGWAAWAI